MFRVFDRYVIDARVIGANQDRHEGRPRKHDSATLTTRNCFAV
jgi:hypothetical protein